MAVASFEELCAGFCELIKVSPPALKADARGLVAFHVVLRGATVILAYRPATNKEHFFVLFELGPVGDGGSNPAAELQALLEANFVLLQVNPPVFSCNPATGDAVLQYVYPLFEVTPNDLHELIDTEIDRLSQWQESLSTGDSGEIPLETDNLPPAMLLQMA